MLNRQTSTLCLVFLVAALLPVSGCSYSPVAAQDDHAASSIPWPISSPEEQNLDDTYLQSMLLEIEDNRIPVESFLIVKNGYLVSEHYFSRNNASTRFPVYSVTKSVTSALTGIAIQEGYIESADQIVLDFFPQIAREVDDSALQNLTIENLLTMSTGYQANTLPDVDREKTDFDTAAAILTNSPISVQPGTVFYYNSAAPYLVSIIIQEQSGKTLEEYANEKIFTPLQIENYKWKSSPQGHNFGNTGLELTARDMAKIGYLYLHSGSWQGEQLIPAGWIEDSTRVHIDTRGLVNIAEDDGYGYFWWINSFGGFSAHGYAGQFIFVLPEDDMVVVFTSSMPAEDFPVPYNLFKTYVLPAARAE